MPRISIHDVPPMTEAEKARIDATTEADIQRFMAVDGEMDDFGDDPAGIGVRRADPDPRELRARLGMTQEQFAAAFGFSQGQLQDWEQGRTRPDGPARVLLRLIDTAPDLVRAAAA